MATGMARGAAARGKRVAFGDGRQILWDHHSPQIFRGNPNIAAPGSEGAADLEWVQFYKGHRIYNRREGDRWVWNAEFRPVPGEVFFSDDEFEFADRQGRDFVLIEPGVPQNKSVAPNKQWSSFRYSSVAELLKRSGRDVRQFQYPGASLVRDVARIKAPSFRHALAVLRNASLYIGPEGGLHHGSAAVNIPAVVLFGGFIPPQVTGYPTHTNLTGGATACGSLKRCAHCIRAMEKISVDDVVSAARKRLAVAA
ncbi:glycosyltransferase family 9 protein [Bradyrhizobium prioriisuperbiae]|uniref:glycosyltransferase family 9 protein n=1 Tax=Bradyrhizobium prioriisuperbiae TaxID=2854389 RepID=UPI0028E27024|nr:glycosyltransferase family 9 protein [Bradyrhizobium prioritasuperba]